jgi:hypothetical protein
MTLRECPERYLKLLGQKILGVVKMEFKFTLEENEIFITNTNLLLERPVVWVNGNKLKKSNKRGKPFIFTTPENNTYTIDIRPRLLGIDPIPKVFVNNEEIQLNENLKWYESLFASLPILLILGGISGGILGAVASVLNFKIMRKEISSLSKILLVCGVTILSLIIYFVAGVSLRRTILS